MIIFWGQHRRMNSSVIWQKGESQNGGNKNTKHAKFSEKRTFFYSLICVRIRGKKHSFFGKFDMLCILVTSVLRFALLPYYWRIVIKCIHFVYEPLECFFDKQNWELYPWLLTDIFRNECWLLTSLWFKKAKVCITARFPVKSMNTLNHLTLFKWLQPRFYNSLKKDLLEQDLIVISVLHHLINHKMCQ